MVKGLDLFQKQFESFKGQYILIGGAACDLLYEDAGLEFRATKDLDIVLCLESLETKFTEALWAFVRAGEYQMRERSSGRPEYFRFMKPKNEKYPFMLELFSRKPDTFVLPDDQRVTRIPTGEDSSSLSAILLDDDYYHLLRSGTREVSGMPVVRAEYLILLKAKAYLDLTLRKDKGEAVDDKVIRKHKNDVFRLFRIVEPELSVEVSATIRKDMRKFVNSMEREQVDLKELGLAGESMESVLMTIEKIFMIED
ncbi:MAG: hypothetical protein ABSE41_07170 [Bacteroidota bacterium]|jgi:hypothetical protein